MGEAEDLANLGNVYVKRGDLQKASDYYRSALNIDKETGNRLGQARNLGNLGILAAEEGDKRRASELLRQATALYEAMGVGGEGPEIVREALQRLEAQD